MGERATNLDAVADGETLVRLPSGIELIRRQKHEPRAVEGLTRDELRVLTNKENGSKFAAGWTLDYYVDWMGTLLAAVEWTFPPNLKFRIRIPLQREIGIADGQPSHTIEIVARGRYVHGYPI